MKKIYYYLVFISLIFFTFKTYAACSGMYEDEYGRWVNCEGGNIFGDSTFNLNADPNFNLMADPNFNLMADPNFSLYGDSSQQSNIFGDSDSSFDLFGD